MKFFHLLLVAFFGWIPRRSLARRRPLMVVGDWH
jgi:hypothetical protein